jgi:3D (Asp-Asp-Asp) domain-containing protein
MAGKEYRARDRKVAKMTREGLTEENLRDGTKKSINGKEEIPKIRSPEYTIERERSRVLDASDHVTSKKNRKYQSKVEIGVESEPPVKAASLHSGEKEVRSRRGQVKSELLKSDQGEMPEDVTDAGKRKRQQGKYEELRTLESEVKSEEAMEDGGTSLHQASSRMNGIREHSAGSAKAYTRSAVETAHNRKKKIVQSRSKRKVFEKETQTMEDFREDVEKKVKREQVNQAQKKVRLSFEDEGGGMVKGSGTGFARKAVSGIGGVTSTMLHGKVHEAESDNTALESAHGSELLAEHATRSLRNAQERSRKKYSYSARLNKAEPLSESNRGLKFGEGSATEGVKSATNHTAQTEASKKSRIMRFWQKKRYKEAYVAAKEGKKIKETAKAAESVTVKVRVIAKQIFKRNSSLLIGICVFALLFGILASSLTSCSAGIQGFSTSFVGTTYSSSDEEIYATENAYLALEQALNEQINSIESRQEGYEDYRYQIDEISHNPYHLISYFTTKYGEFSYEHIKDELEEIFREQYGLTTQSQQETVTETKTVRVGESLGQVVTSGYCNCPICCGQWSGGPTASGAMPTASHTIAVDASTPFVPMGTKVVMNGVEYTVEDTGNFTQYGVQFDVYYGDHASASAHGHQTWDAYIADSNGSQEIEVTTTENVNRLNVTLTNHNLDTVLRNRMTDDEIARYELYNYQYGNRDYLFDLNTLPVGGGGGGFGYQIPSEALSDERFANMIHEAEKYLGYPYVWGGASPSTSFDCSGFVCWVINNCGNGWNVGRQTADGIRGSCAQVSPSEAKPGDLIFFERTYETPGASHIGIYVGDGMMIHCGNPIQYASIETAYWQEHFMAFGRLP